MEERVKNLANSSYIERFQFILQINENIICQRYFRIHGVTNAALESEEFKSVMDEVVGMIQQDLVSKSRIYDWYTSNLPIKLTGFVKDGTGLSDLDYKSVIMGDKDTVCEFENGETLEKTFMSYPEGMTDSYQDLNRPADGEFVFKFSFLDNNHVKYERIWDGNVYHKFVRNGVDLSNSDYLYRDKDPLSLYFNIAIIRYMTIDKTDLNYHIIKRICNVLSNSGEDGEYEYTNVGQYGNKKYEYSTRNTAAIRSWEKAVKKKTDEYFSTLFPSKKKIEYIEKFM